MPPSPAFVAACLTLLALLAIAAWARRRAGAKAGFGMPWPLYYSAYTAPCDLCPGRPWCAYCVPADAWDLRGAPLARYEAQLRYYRA